MVIIRNGHKNFQGKRVLFGTQFSDYSADQVHVYNQVEYLWLNFWYFTCTYRVVLV